MASRVNYYFRQKVTQSELDLGFELLEKADRDLAADIGIYGIISGAEPLPHSPVPDLTIDLTAPGRSYDRLGQRIYFGAEQHIDCAIDHTGIPTEVSTSGNERWLGVFLKFDRLESDPRTDGNSQQIYFRQDESFQILVRQAPEGPIGSATNVPLEEDELLVCDIRRSAGQTQIRESDIDTSRRQAFILANGDAVEVVSSLWNVLQPAVNTVQASLDSVDSHLDGHFDGSDDRHPAASIDYDPHGFIAADNIQNAIDEIVDDLSSTDSAGPGAALVGADAVTGTPNSLPPGHVASQLVQLLAWLNSHITKSPGAHTASAISAHTHNYLTENNVQAQIQELIGSLLSESAPAGASRIGNNSITGNPNDLTTGTLRDQLAELLGHINTHVGSDDHDPRYYTKSQSNNRFYQVGDTVADSERLDGLQASEFSLLNHNHDYRYLRPVYWDTRIYAPGENIVLTDLDEFPFLVTSSYNTASDGLPSSTTYINGGQHTNDILIRTVQQPAGYSLRVRNGATATLQITVAVFQNN